jgi:hypothetical protein
VPLDRLVVTMKTTDSIPVRYIDPALLIPTDEPRSAADFHAYVKVFRQRRAHLLDPVFVVEDPELSPRGYVVQGHHRAAAAMVTRRHVRVAILRTREDLLALVTDGDAAIVAGRSRQVADFVAECRQRARELQVDRRGWAAWLEIGGLAFEIGLRR